MMIKIVYRKALKIFGTNKQSNKITELVFLFVKASNNAGGFGPHRHQSLAPVSALGSDTGTLQTRVGEAW